jgi:hypothetical protein
MVIEGVFDVRRSVLAIVQSLQHVSFGLPRGTSELTSKFVSFSQNSKSGTILGPSTRTIPPLAGAAGAGLGVQYNLVVPSVGC